QVAFAVIVPAQITINDWMIHRRQFTRAQILLTEQAVDRTGGDRAEEFAFRIGPLVAQSSIEEQRPRRNPGDYKMLVTGQLIPVTGVRLNIAGKLPVKVVRHVIQRFAVIAPRERCPHLASATREDCGNPLILRAGPEGGFAETRVPLNRDLCSV